MTPRPREAVDIIDRRRMVAAEWCVPDTHADRDGLRKWVLYGDISDIDTDSLLSAIDLWETHDNAREAANAAIGPDPGPVLRLRAFVATLPLSHRDRPGALRAIDVLLGDDDGHTT